MEDIEGRVVVYSIVGCPHCVQAKRTLQSHGLPYVDVSVDRFPGHVREWLRETTKKSSVPQIFFNERLIGGNEQLQQLVNDEEEFQKALSDLRTTPPNDDSPSPPLLPNPGEATDMASSLDDTERFHCELDEYAVLIQEMRKAGVVRTHRKGGFCSFKKVKDSFTGKDFVDWAEDKKLISRERAVFMGKQLVSRRFGVSSDGELEFRDDANTLYKLSTSSGDTALNASKISECVQRPAQEIAEDLRNLILKLYGQHITEDGKAVDYKGIAQSKLFQSYKRMTLELQRVDLEKLSRDDRLAFFINIYNALVIHGMVENGVPANLWQRYKFYANTSYNIGGYVYSLNDIENGILRSNRSSVGTLYMKPFEKNDPRMKLALDEAEPRIHFALNCGAKSCPPIKTYSGKEVDSQLKLATESYLENSDAIRLDQETATVYLSMLFKWYQRDFGKDQERVLKWIYQRMTDEDKKKQLSDIIQNAEYQVKWIPYDWGHNDKE